jgi:hypothetical protein
MTIETDLLLILIPEEGATADKLEYFIADILYRAGVWDSPSTSDGITFWRVVERDPTCVRFSARIHELAQEAHTFWLDLERDKGRPDQVNWTLYFDIIPGAWSPRRISTIAEAIEAPEQVDWRVRIKGDAAPKAASLVAESVYVIPVERGLDACPQAPQAQDRGLTA